MTANTLSEVLKYSITENCTINMNNIMQKEMNPLVFFRLSSRRRYNHRNQIFFQQSSLA